VTVLKDQARNLTMENAKLFLRGFLSLVAVVGWLFFLLLQTGMPWDETEHAHVAWLMSQGKRPLVDFFQHHQPLLWNLLTPYFRLGFKGAGVLVWGRLLVVCSAVAIVISLHRLGHWLGVALFIGLTLILPDWFVIRPETISAALLVAGLAIWDRPTASNVAAALAGAAAGAAVYASPRFALLGGFFLLLGRQSVSRWACLVAGATVFVALYTVLAGYPLSQVIFNIEFSAHLQTVGDSEQGLRKEFWLWLLVCTCGPLSALTAAIDRQHRTLAMLFLAYSIALFLMCDRLAGHFRYVQAYGPFLNAIPIATARITQHVRLGSRTPPKIWIGAAILLLWIGIMELTPTVSLPQLGLVRWMQARKQLDARISPQQKVLLYTLHMPITGSDVSYYGSPLGDGQDRLCTAVRTFKTTRLLPPCDFLADLKKRPYLTESTLQAAVSDDEQEQVTSLLHSDYNSVWFGPPVGKLEVRK